MALDPEMVGVEDGFHFGVVDVVFPALGDLQDERNAAAKARRISEQGFVIRPDRRELRGGSRAIQTDFPIFPWSRPVFPAAIPENSGKEAGMNDRAG